MPFLPLIQSKVKQSKHGDEFAESILVLVVNGEVVFVVSI